jgi:hypothetical protein
MSDRLSIRVTGDEDADRRIRQLALGLQDLRSFWPLVVPVATSWWKRQFDTEGAFGGQAWQALSPATVERKAALGLRPNILQATGQLKMAASRPERTVTPRSLTLTIEDDKLSYHQTGTSRMPARPLVFGGETLPPVAAAELQLVADRYVRDLLSRF